MKNRNSEYVTTERVGLVVAEMMRGRSMTTSEVGALVGITRQGALRTMNLLCRVLPLTLDDDGRWKMISGGNNGG